MPPRSAGDPPGVNTFTAVLTVPITSQGLSPAFKCPQAEPDLSAGIRQPGTSRIRLANQLNGHVPGDSSGETYASSEQKGTHFFRSTNNAAIFAMAFSLHCGSFLRALISRWSWARSFLIYFCSAIVSTGLAWHPELPAANAPPAPGSTPIPAVGAQLGGIKPSGFDHHRELVSSAQAVWFLFGSRQYLSLQPPRLALFVEGDYVDAQLL